MQLENWVTFFTYKTCLWVTGMCFLKLVGNADSLMVINGYKLSKWYKWGAESAVTVIVAFYLNLHFNLPFKNVKYS